jgi:hypothetical protein
MTSRSRIAGVALAAAGLGIVMSLAGAVPAQAAATCTNVGTDGAYATANCTGVGTVRINVRCNAIWPFTQWTDYGSWTSINGGGTIVNSHAYCAASTTVWVQYA